MAKTTRCTPAVRAGRLDKARQFRVAAEVVDGYAADDDALIDACITMCVHAGIAAADAICCARLGQHARGDDHRDAVALLERVGRKHGADLAVLLAMKTRSAYGGSPSSSKDLARAKRAMTRLVDAAIALPPET